MIPFATEFATESVLWMPPQLGSFGHPNFLELPVDSQQQLHTHESTTTSSTMPAMPSSPRSGNSFPENDEGWMDAASQLILSNSPIALEYGLSFTLVPVAHPCSRSCLPAAAHQSVPPWDQAWEILYSTTPLPNPTLLSSPSEARPLLSRDSEATSSTLCCRIKLGAWAKLNSLPVTRPTTAGPNPSGSDVTCKGSWLLDCISYVMSRLLYKAGPLLFVPTIFHHFTPLDTHTYLRRTLVSVILLYTGIRRISCA